jgi:hypothetical protein
MTGSRRVLVSRPPAVSPSSSSSFALPVTVHSRVISGMPVTRLSSTSSESTPSAVAGWGPPLRPGSDPKIIVLHFE